MYPNISINNLFIVLIVFSPVIIGKDIIKNQKLGYYAIMDQKVYNYDGYLYIPYVLNTPIKGVQDYTSGLNYRSITDMFNENIDQCPIQDLVMNYLKSAEEYLETMLPDQDNIKPSYSDITEVIDQEKYSSQVIQRQLDTNKMSMIKNPGNLERKLKMVTLSYDNLSGNNLSHRSTSMTNKRKKRVAPLIIFAGVAILGLIAGGFAWNRQDIETAKSRLDNIDLNMDKIERAINSHADSLNILKHNSDWFHQALLSVNNDTNNIIQIVKCDQFINRVVMNDLSSWLYLTINSFIRALNSALLGDINIDLISGKTLRELIKHHIELRGTLYINNPTLIYKIGKFELMKIIKKGSSPSIIGMIILPNVRDGMIGYSYHQFYCPFFIRGNLHKLLSENNIYYETEGKTWMEYNREQCVTSFDFLLCPPASTSGKHAECVNSIMSNNLSTISSDCLISKYPNKYKGLVIPTKMGLILCPTNGIVSIFNMTTTGVEKSYDLDLKYESCIVTSFEANKLRYGNDIHTINDYLPLNLTSVQLNQHSIIIDSIEETKIFDSWKPMNELEHVNLIKNSTSHHDIILYSIIALLIIILCIMIYFMRKHVQNLWKGFYTLALFKSKNPSDQKVDERMVDNLIVSQ